MTPQEDWLALDHLTETEAKFLLRMAVTNLRCITDLVQNPLEESSFSPNGQQHSFGFAKGFLLTFESKYQEKLQKEADREKY